MSGQRIIEEALALQPQIVAWRRDFHMHPELGFQEVRTAGIVAEELERLGYKVRRQVGKTGVLGDLDVLGARTRILLRADMDALPVQEESGEPFSSQTPGVAHLCGHDSHVATLLGAARILMKRRGQLKSSVRLMFQPSEERGPGGAQAMMAEGCLDGVDRAIAIHVFTAHESGKWCLRAGPIMAATDSLHITIHGRGGHAATPEVCIDPVVVAAQIILTSQTIMSRRIRPHDCGVLSLCSIHGGDAFNVIPETVTIVGTLRTHSESARAQVKRIFRDMLNGLEVMSGARIDMEFGDSYPVTVNDARVTEDVRRTITAMFGAETILDIDRKFGGEDFAYILQQVPGVDLFLGVGNVAKGATAAHHNAKFKIDEDVLWQASALFAQLALEYEGEKK